MILVVCAYCVAYAMAVWYLDNVWPWQYGIPKEPLFFMRVYRNKTVAVRHVSLKAYPGDVTVLLGRNGAGKTTLLRLITGLDQATEGSVYVGGFNVALETDAARHSMGFCPQENVLFMGAHGPRAPAILRQGARFHSGKRLFWRQFGLRHAEMFVRKDSLQRPHSHHCDNLPGAG
ncbi:hypothetical protein HPB48_004957 [Haemaphysalis longicornis]|uniref:ABC transporter domain-containing protein n=1 Tax=Haemaphysalis longicornis TaxID=44386 RepID=A0A9J6GFT8_HAELO|nr:hypothetical protein HPB48_004957 [Haemaphysalis longicornis]